MTGNPASDQYAATVRDKLAAGNIPDGLQFHIDYFADAIKGAIPNLDPHTIGEVLLHTGVGFAEILVGLTELGYPASEAVTMGCNIVAGAGGVLYNTQETP